MATVKELRAQAKAQGIKGYSGMRKAELESALSLQTTTEKTSEKAEHLLRASYWEQKTLLNEEYSLYDILRLLAEYGVRNSLYEYECKQYFFRTGKKARADFILKHVLLDWLHERAEGHEKVSEPISAERTEEAKAALKNLTAEDDFNAMSAKMCHNNEEIEKATTETELEDLLNTADEYTLRYMLKRKGYETEKAEAECTKAELVKAYVKEEMQLRREAKALDELGYSGLIAKTRELKKQLDACNSECEMEEVLKSYTKAELVMMSANINNYSLKIIYFQSRDKLARDFAREYWFMTRTLHEFEKNLTEKNPATETTEETMLTMTEAWTDEDFDAYFPDGEITEDDIIELTSDELDSLNDYLKRKRESEELKYRSAKYPLMLRKQPEPEPDNSEGDMLYVIRTGDDIGEMRRKLEHNFKKVERSTNMQDMTYLLGTTNLHTVYLMLKARGYETKFEEWQSVKHRVVSDFVKQEMRKREERKMRELRITQNVCLQACTNAKHRHEMYAERSHELKEQLEINRMYAATFMKSGHEVPEALRALIAEESEEYQEVRLSSFRSYVKYREYKAKYDEAEIALGLLESYESKKELSA